MNWELHNVCVSSKSGFGQRSYKKRFWIRFKEITDFEKWTTKGEGEFVIRWKVIFLSLKDWLNPWVSPSKWHHKKWLNKSTWSRFCEVPFYRWNEKYQQVRNELCLAHEGESLNAVAKSSQSQLQYQENV